MTAMTIFNNLALLKTALTLRYQFVIDRIIILN